VLRKLENIVCHDALIKDNGSEYHWPKVDVIVGNPPFIVARKLKPELGKEYVETLRKTYKGRISDGSDFVCFWFLKSYDYMKTSQLKRAGLVSTNSIRGGKNRLVLGDIYKEFEIFDAWADEAWVNEGASVRVSMTCFSLKKQNNTIKINGKPAEVIYSDLTARIDNVGTDLSQAKKLTLNENIAFQGVVPRSEVNKKAKDKLGLPDASFFVSGKKAREFLSMPINPNGRPNSDVI
jgi:type II restriction/modification system DNA methylase subunit YeeA